MNNQFDWSCEADSFGSLATEKQFDTFMANVESNTSTWRIRVFQAEPCIWYAEITLFRFANARAKKFPTAFGLSSKEKASGFWKLGSFLDVEQAKSAAEFFVSVRRCPHVWRPVPLLPYETFGDFSSSQIDALRNNADVREALNKNAACFQGGAA